MLYGAVLRDRLPELRRARAQTIETIRTLKAEYIALIKREGEGELDDAERTRIDELLDSISEHANTLENHESRITRAETALGYEADNSTPVDDATRGGNLTFTRDGRPAGTRAEARVRRPDHETEPSLVIGGLARMIAAAGGNAIMARQVSTEVLGERHPVTECLVGARGYSGYTPDERRALMASIGPAGGFIVPPDYVAELIEILRPMTVVRDAGPRILEMPRGTMQMPRQNQAATATYGTETAAIPVSQQAVGQIVATYKKLTAMTPITNDLMRYSDPAVDGIVRDDLAAVIARREDLAYIRGDGTAGSPQGFASFCLSGQKIASTASYTLATAASELGGLLNKLESANIQMQNVVWIMHPRSKNYLLNVQNANGFYVYRDEMVGGTLLGWPFKTTTQIPTNLSVSPNSDCSEVYAVAMREALLFDSMRLELAVSREGTYTDANNALVSVFQNDQTLIRAIAEHDFHMRHDEAVAMLTGVRWAPAIS